jgi:hypothetical protein
MLVVTYAQSKNALSIKGSVAISLEPAAQTPAMRRFAFFQSVCGRVGQAAHDFAVFFIELSPRAHQTFAAARAFVMGLLIHHYIFRH